MPAHSGQEVRLPGIAEPGRRRRAGGALLMTERTLVGCSVAATAAPPRVREQRWQGLRQSLLRPSTATWAAGLFFNGTADTGISSCFVTGIHCYHCHFSWSSGLRVGSVFAKFNGNQSIAPSDWKSQPVALQSQISLGQLPHLFQGFIRASQQVLSPFIALFPHSTDPHLSYHNVIYLSCLLPVPIHKNEKSRKTRVSVCFTHRCILCTLNKVWKRQQLSNYSCNE